MNDLNITLYLFAFILLFGAVFTSQCDRDSETDRSDLYQEQEEIGVDREDRRFDGTVDDHQTLSTQFGEDRSELIEKMEELRDNLNEELDNRSESTNEVSERMYEQMQNDHDELDRILRSIESTWEDNRDEVRSEAEQIYDRIYSRYEERNLLDE